MATLAERRRQRVRDTQNWRARLKRGAIVLPVEVDGEVFDLMVRYGFLTSGQETDRREVAGALEKLLHRAMVALRRERPKKI